MESSKVEFAVQMTGKNCEEKIRKSLENVGKVEIDTNSGQVIVFSKLPWSDIKDKIESTGRKAVLSGFGEQSAVAIMDKGCYLIKGIVRFSTINDTNSNGCIIDGIIDGLDPGEHGLHIHECGDISEGCASLGDHYNPRQTRHGSPESNIKNRHAGDLGNITADENGRATFRFTDSVLSVSEIIGRSLVVTEFKDDFGTAENEQSLIDGNSGKRLSCGIIARAAGIFQNYKKFCACDGITIWDERDKPIAGVKRQVQTGYSPKSSL